MPYKKDCNFRKKLDACTFSSKDCTRDTCDFYKLKWDWVSLLIKLKKEQRLINKMKKKGVDDKAAVYDKEYGAYQIARAITLITGVQLTQQQKDKVVKDLSRAG